MTSGVFRNLQRADICGIEGALFLEQATRSWREGSEDSPVSGAAALCGVFEGPAVGEGFGLH